MVLNLFKRAISGYFKNYNMDLNPADLNGSTHAMTPNLLIDGWKNGGYIRVGSGSGNNDADDYALSNDITSSLTSISLSSFDNTVTSNYLAVTSQTYQNNTNESITVREIGLTIPTSNGTYLFTKKNLDTPVVIAPGEAYSFNITLKL